MSKLKQSRGGESASDNVLYTNIRQLIEESKQRVFTSVNAQITMLYWNIGKYISENLKTCKSSDYGKNILPTLSAKLVGDYGKGGSHRNLANMIKLFSIFPEKEILQTLSAKLNWSHFVKSSISKDNIHRKLLELDASGIHVAEYLTELPEKAWLQGKLHKAIELSRQQLKNGGENEWVEGI